MNVVLWWFVLMILVWIAIAAVLWGTDLVVASGEDGLEESPVDDPAGREGPHE